MSLHTALTLFTVKCLSLFYLFDSHSGAALDAESCQLDLGTVSFTCDATDRPLQVRSYESGQVSSQTDADEMNGAQRRSFPLQTDTMRAQSQPELLSCSQTDVDPVSPPWS